MEMLTRGFSEQAADSQTSLVPAMAMPTVVELFTAGVFPQILEKVNPSSQESSRKLIIAASDKQSWQKTFQWGAGRASLNTKRIQPGETQSQGIKQCSFSECRNSSILELLTTIAPEHQEIRA